MVGHGYHVRCKVSAPDGFAAVDKAVEKLEHQLHKLKTKVLRRSHQHARRPNGATAESETTAVAGETEVDVADGAEPRIVKTKTLQMKPMTPHEATLQMELLGHDFFFFMSADTERASVVYRRDDGDIGLIDQA